MGPVLVTGATGFLGGSIARRLARMGVKVRATGRNLRAGALLEAEGIPFVACELSGEEPVLNRWMEGCEVVIHAAALSAPWGRRQDFEAANVVATREVIRACARSGVRRLVHVSSTSVSFAFQHQSRLHEGMPWSEPPANHYIATKREAERMAVEAGAVVLRPRALFGPGDTTLLPRLVRVARRGVFPLFGDGDPLLELTWIEDATDATLLAMEAPAHCLGRVYQISSGHPLPRSLVLGTLLEACGLDVRFRRVPIGLFLAIAGGMEMISKLCTGETWEPPLTRYAVGVLGFEQTHDIGAARRELGYAPETDVRSALVRCGEAWRREQGRKG
jgi:nucleoside-diphosphate-sugar epimerase